MSDRKKILKNEILDHIHQQGVARFLITEIEDVFEYFNPYKLKNMLNNITMFTTFVNELDQQNTNLYKKLIDENSENINSEKQNNNKLSKLDIKEVSFDKYISIKWRNDLSLKQKKYFSKMSKQEKSTVCTTIRGLFVLTISDFAQGSYCRLENKYHHRIEPSFLEKR